MKDFHRRLVFMSANIHWPTYTVISQSGVDVEHELTFDDKIMILDHCLGYEATDIYSLGLTFQALYTGGDDDDGHFKEMIVLMLQ